MLFLTLLACAGSRVRLTDTGNGLTSQGYAFTALSDLEPSDTSDTGDPTDTEETGDSPILDADGDGHLAESDGGDDCDDTNPRVYPGAEDWCTAIDEDCDGVAIDDGRCADMRAFLSRATKFAEEGYFGMLPVRDLTGDGLDDLLIFDGYGDAGVAPGDGTWEGFADWPEAAAWGVPGGCARDEVHLDLGDIDGDGYNDVAFSTGGCGGGYDIAWGPFDGSQSEPPVTRWEGPEPFAAVEQRWVDADGDGATDLLYWSVDEAANEDQVILYFGGQRTAEMTVITSERTGNAGQDRLGDVDGDGCDDFEIAYGRTNQPTWFSGSGLLRGVAVVREDVMAGEISSADGVEMDGKAYPEWVSVGDWSGDGLDDAIFIDTESHRGSPFYYDDFTSSTDVVPGGRVDNDVVEDQIGIYTSPLRQDGVPRMLLLSNNTGEPEEYIVLPDDWITGTNNLSELRHLVIGNEIDESNSARQAHGWGLGDIDGDGWSDVAAEAYPGAYHFTPFDDIPWSEDRYW